MSRARVSVVSVVLMVLDLDDVSGSRQAIFSLSYRSADAMAYESACDFLNSLMAPEVEAVAASDGCIDGAPEQAEKRSG